jgi:hypothetical protein
VAEKNNIINARSGQMKKIFYASTGILLTVLLLVGCARWGGNNPVGVTGGSEEGYGEFKDLGIISSSGSSAQLVGTWRHDYGGGDYEILEIQSNGRFQISVYDNNNLELEYSGNYTVSGNTITLWIEGQPVTVNYSLDGDFLTLFFEGEQTTYYRVS